MTQKFLLRMVEKRERKHIHSIHIPSKCLVPTLDLVPCVGLLYFCQYKIVKIFRAIQQQQQQQTDKNTSIFI